MTALEGNSRSNCDVSGAGAGRWLMLAWITVKQLRTTIAAVTAVALLLTGCGDSGEPPPFEEMVELSASGVDQGGPRYYLDLEGNTCDVFRTQPEIDGPEAALQHAVESCEVDETQENSVLLFLEEEGRICEVLVDLNTGVYKLSDRPTNDCPRAPLPGLVPSEPDVDVLDPPDIPEPPDETLPTIVDEADPDEG